MRILKTPQGNSGFIEKLNGLSKFALYLILIDQIVDQIWSILPSIHKSKCWTLLIVK